MCDGLCLNDVRAESKVTIDPLHFDFNFFGNFGGVSISTFSRKSILDDVSKALALQYIQSLDKKDIAIDKGTGCISHVPTKTRSPRLKLMENKVQKNGPRMHIVACHISNVLPGDFFQKDYDASHLCANEKCFNPNHLVWELRRTNNIRTRCFSLVEINGEIWKTNRECRCGERNCRQVKLKAGSEWEGLEE
jgi:hypothetical protein